MPLEIIDLNTLPAQPSIEEQRVQLAARWTMRSMSPRLTEIDKRLKKALHLAQLDLGAAIMAMDEAAADPSRHSMAEQMMVELATDNHSRALANYVRGEEPDDVGN